VPAIPLTRVLSRAEKERIVATSLEPGAIASEVARAAGIHASQLFRWRQQLCTRPQVPATFNPVAVTPEPGAPIPPLAERAGTIEIELIGGGRMRIIYLPKYSPDLNPIELAFSKLKAHLRKAAEHTIPRLLRRIGRVVTDFSARECRNFFRHAGYVRT
jgi:transposase